MASQHLLHRGCVVKYNQNLRVHAPIPVLSGHILEVVGDRQSQGVGDRRSSARVIPDDFFDAFVKLGNVAFHIASAGNFSAIVAHSNDRKAPQHKERHPGSSGTLLTF